MCGIQYTASELSFSGGYFWNLLLWAWRQTFLLIFCTCQPNRAALSRLWCHNMSYGRQLPPIGRILVPLFLVSRRVAYWTGLPWKRGSYDPLRRPYLYTGRTIQHLRRPEFSFLVFTVSKFFPYKQRISCSVDKLCTVGYAITKYATTNATTTGFYQ